MKNNYWILLKSRTKSPKKFYQKAAHKAAEGTREFMGNKIANEILKPKPVSQKNWEILKE